MKNNKELYLMQERVKKIKQIQDPDERAIAILLEISIVSAHLARNLQKKAQNKKPLN